jgi:hypothetical protein
MYPLVMFSKNNNSSIFEGYSSERHKCVAILLCADGIEILTVADHQIASIIQGQPSEGLKMLGSLIDWDFDLGSSLQQGCYMH